MHTLWKIHKKNEVPFRGSTERAPTKTKKTPLIIYQEKQNDLRDKVKRLRLRRYTQPDVKESTYPM